MDRVNPFLRFGRRLVLIAGCFAGVSAWTSESRLAFTILGEDAVPVPCRIHLKNPAGKPVRAGGLLARKAGPGR